MVSAWRTAERRPSKPQAVVGSPPQTTCAHGAAPGPARALEADDRPPAPRRRRRTPRSGSRAGSGCAARCRAPRRRSASRAACTRRSPPSSRRGRPRSPRRATDEKPRAAAARVKSNCDDLERGVGRVLEHVGVAELRPRSARRRPRPGRRRAVARADHRVEVGGDREAALVHAGRPRLLGLAPALLVAAREVVEVGLRDRQRHVGARCSSSSSSSCSSVPPGWIQGPNTHGAGGGGWRPVRAVNRRSTSAGFGPAKNRRLSVRGRARGRRGLFGRSVHDLDAPACRRRGGSSWSRGCRRARRSRRSRAARAPGSRSRRRAGASPTAARTPRSAATRRG